VRRGAAQLRIDRHAERVIPHRFDAAWPVGLLSGIITFFAVVALAAALSAGRLAEVWGAGLGSPATLQIVAAEADVEAQARAALEVLRTTPGVQAVRAVEIEEQRSLLEPWLGSDLPVDSLPLPLLIEVSVDRGRLDAAALRADLAAAAPAAVFDDHAAWRAPLAESAAALRRFALASIGLMGVALIAVLVLAARASVAVNGPVIRTLRLVGARDGFIGGAFTRRFVLDATAGAVLGTLAAMVLLSMLPPTREEGFYLVGIGLQGWHWLLPVLAPPVAGALAWIATRVATRRQLRRWS
jgi:cell division transport system permease protein